MNILDIRENNGITQEEASKIVGVPLRTYQRYENDNSYGDLYKRKHIEDTLREYFLVTEEKGLLSIEFIKNELEKLFDSKYKGQIEFCYLFGSYSKGYATEKSDVDLCISCSLVGFGITGLAEEIRKCLHKNIDLIRFDTLSNNFELVKEIMKDGIKIYG